MNWRAYFGTLGLCLVALMLVVELADYLDPPEPEILMEGGVVAYTAQYLPKAKPLIIRPAPKPPAPPKRHRLKTNMEPFNRFEFDQRTIV